MRYVAVLLCVLMGGGAVAHRGDEVLTTASQLRDWCKAESEAQFIGQGKIPSNWSASYWDEGNVLIAKGSWRIDAGTVGVECRVARGARSEFASMQILQQ